MTQQRNTSPLKGTDGFKVSIEPEGRKIHFEKECLERVSIFRRINDEEWKEIGKNARTPFIDSERFEKPVRLAYKVVFQNQDGNAKPNIIDVHIN